MNGEAGNGGKFFLKSKTVDLNTLAAALVALLGQMGLQMSPEMVGTAFAVLNIILRFFTKEPVFVKKPAGS